jgi:hypothetical protein
VEDQGRHLTEAEKQIRRLEALRQQREETSKASTEKAYFPAKTQAARIEDRLKAMRRQAEDSPRKSRRAKIEGKQKSSKLTFVQIRVLEQLLGKDKRLRGSAITRIALNRLLNLENTAEENELESRINEFLRQLKNQA